MVIILAIIYIPVCVFLLFGLISASKNKINKQSRKNSFTVYIPEFVAAIGVGGVVISTIVVIIQTFQTFLSAEQPPITAYIVFYGFFGGFIYLCAYLIVRTFKWKVVVSYDIITVYPLLYKPYSFTVNNIVSAKRQVKNNKVKSERIVIHTDAGKKLIVENAEVSYMRFLKMIKLNANPEVLKGFDL